jgi:hypothetical protein
LLSVLCAYQQNIFHNAWNRYMRVDTETSRTRKGIKTTPKHLAPMPSFSGVTKFLRNDTTASSTMVDDVDVDADPYLNHEDVEQFRRESRISSLQQVCAMTVFSRAQGLLLLSFHLSGPSERLPLFFSIQQERQLRLMTTPTH